MVTLHDILGIISTLQWGKFAETANEPAPHSDRSSRDSFRTGSYRRRIAAGIRVPVAIGDFLILNAVRESDGFATAVDDDAIVTGLAEVSQREGLLLCPEGAATYAAWKQELRSGRVSADDNCVLFNCASGLKYPLAEANQRLNCRQPINFDAF